MADTEKSCLEQWARDTSNELYGITPRDKELKEKTAEYQKFVEQAQAIQGLVGGLKNKLLEVYPIGGKNPDPIAATQIVDSLQGALSQYLEKNKDAPKEIVDYVNQELGNISSYKLDIELATVYMLKEAQIGKAQAQKVVDQEGKRANQLSEHAKKIGVLQ